MRRENDKVEEFYRGLKLHKIEPRPGDWRELVDRIFELEGPRCPSYALVNKHMKHYGFYPPEREFSDYYGEKFYIYKFRERGVTEIDITLAERILGKGRGRRYFIQGMFQERDTVTSKDFVERVYEDGNPIDIQRLERWLKRGMHGQWI